MVPLPSTRRALVWFNMCPNDDGNSVESKWSRVARVSLPWIAFIISLCGVAAFGSFILQNAADHLEDCLFSIMGFMITICTVYAILFAYFSREQVTAIFEQLTTICSKCVLPCHEMIKQQLFR